MRKDPNTKSSRNESQELPPQVKDLKNRILNEETRQEEFDLLKRHLFQWGVYVALFGYAVLVILLCAIVAGYMYALVWTEKEIPSNFWHLPLIVCLVATTTLYLTLKLSSSFGKDKLEITDERNYLFSEVETEDLPVIAIIKECHGAMKNSIKKIKGVLVSRKGE